MRKETLSVMFSDIKGDSSLTDHQLGSFVSKFSEDLARSVIDRYRSELVEFNTWGDAYIAVTTDAGLLAEFSLWMRDHFNNYSWERLALPKLELRTSLHVGTAFIGYDPLRQRDNSVAGVQINLGARIEPVTQPGEVWVSEEFYTLVRRDAHSIMYRFDSLGIQALAKNHGYIPLYRLCRANELPKPVPSNPQIKLSEIIGQLQLNLIPASTGTVPGNFFSRSDLQKFSEQMTARNVASILKNDPRFQELLADMSQVDIREWSKLETCVRPLRATWAENRRTGPDGQTEAGQEAERILASLVLYVLRTELMDLQEPGNNCSELSN